MIGYVKTTEEYEIGEEVYYDNNGGQPTPLVEVFDERPETSLDGEHIYLVEYNSTPYCFGSTKLLRLFVPREDVTKISLRNTGNRNTGDCNTGNCNTGDCNTGNWNTGDWNTGDCNTGNWNTGDWNTGDCNTGEWNTGNWNAGNCNTGDCNTGNWNTGNWNTGNWNTGCFNTETPNIRLFNKETDMSPNELLTDERYMALNSAPRLTEWVIESEMSEKEKAEHPECKTTGGYLKKHENFGDLMQNWWDELTDEKRSLVMDLPNFDAQIFYECTGIKVRKDDK